MVAEDHGRKTHSHSKLILLDQTEIHITARKFAIKITEDLQKKRKNIDEACCSGPSIWPLTGNNYRILYPTLGFKEPIIMSLLGYESIF